jgi:hypothetical protein
MYADSEQLYISLQGKETSVQDEYRAPPATKCYFLRQRQETAFDAFYYTTVT